MKPTLPLPKTQVAGLAVRVLLVITTVWLVLDVTGFGKACDALLREQFYAMRGDRPTKQKVILVTIDAQTVSAWGPAPWREDRITAMFGAIQKGTPRAVGIAGDSRLVMGSLPIPAGVVFDSGPAGGLVTRMLGAAKLQRDDRATNYVGKRGLPTLSAAQVASGDIPSSTFTGKLVIVGVTSQPYAGFIATPIGSLTAVQDQAHRLASIVDGTGWTVMPDWLKYLVLAVASVIAMIISRKAHTLWALVLGIALAAVMLVLDYILFATGIALFGATIPLAAMFISPAFERIRERRLVRRDLTELGAWTRQRAAQASMRVDVSDEQAYWHRVAGLARLYLGCTSTIVAELPADHTRLELRAINGTSARQIADRDLDVRKNPFRTAHVLHTPVWHDTFIAGGTTATLLVPLVVRGKTTGFWIVNFQGRPRDHLTASHMALVRTLALELALAIDRRKQQVTVARDGVVDRLLGRGRIAQELGEIRQQVRWQTQHQQDLLALGESMPFGVFVATLWGEIRYMNAAMKGLCSQEGLDPSDTGNSLPDVLVKLTGFHSEDVHEQLRKLVQELAELHLRGRDREGRSGHDFVLSWLKPAAGTAPDAAEHLLLVCALPRRFADQRVRETRTMLPLDNKRPSDDALTAPVPRSEIDKIEKKIENHVESQPESRPESQRESQPEVETQVESRVDRPTQPAVDGEIETAAPEPAPQEDRGCAPEAPQVEPARRSVKLPLEASPEPPLPLGDKGDEPYEPPTGKRKPRFAAGTPRFMRPPTEDEELRLLIPAPPEPGVDPVTLPVPTAMLLTPIPGTMKLPSPNTVSIPTPLPFQLARPNFLSEVASLHDRLSRFEEEITFVEANGKSTHALRPIPVTEPLPDITTPMERVGEADTEQEPT